MEKDIISKQNYILNELQENFKRFYFINIFLKLIVQKRAWYKNFLVGTLVLFKTYLK